MVEAEQTKAVDRSLGSEYFTGVLLFSVRAKFAIADEDIDANDQPDSPAQMARARFKVVCEGTDAIP